MVLLILGSVYHIDKGGWNWFKLTGYDVARAEHYPHWTEGSLAHFMEKYKIFSHSHQDSSAIVLPRGEYECKETIVVPEGASLKIEPGVILKFHAGCSLISYSPIFAVGTESEPIVFTAKNKHLKWGAVGIFKTGRSVFEHVRFEEARRARVNAVDFLGGLSVIDSDVTVRFCQFLNLFGKDAMNVQRGNVLITNNLFQNIYKDGLDLDGGSGEISFNQFIDCGDEGIDLSDNYDVRVFNNTILDAKGGRMAADNYLSELEKQNILGFSTQN